MRCRCKDKCRCNSMRPMTDLGNNTVVGSSRQCHSATAYLFPKRPYKPEGIRFRSSRLHKEYRRFVIQIFVGRSNAAMMRTGHRMTADKADAFKPPGISPRLNTFFDAPDIRDHGTGLCGGVQKFQETECRVRGSAKNDQIGID